jgi:hypothetical protein
MFHEVVKMSDRNIAEHNPCPECAHETISKLIGTPKIVSGAGSTLSKAGEGWRNVLGRIKTGSGKDNTIHD